MFLIVLDLRLRKVGVEGKWFFYGDLGVIFGFVFVGKKRGLGWMEKGVGFEVKGSWVLYEMELGLKCSENSCEFED